MERVVYRSVCSPDFRSSDLLEIIAASERNNPGRQITGFLIHDQDRFFQLFEGPANETSALLATLKTDPRHHSLEVLEKCETGIRWFPDWRMRPLISFSSTPALEDLKTALADKAGGDQLLGTVTDFVAI